MKTSTMPLLKFTHILLLALVLSACAGSNQAATLNPGFEARRELIG